MTTYTFVTVTFNSRDDLTRHWSNARELGGEWIVVDNCSADDSAEIAETLGARVVRLPRNVGFSAANNVGAALSATDCIIFANPDVTASASGSAEIARFAVETGSLVAPQLINADGSLQENGRSDPYLYRKFLHFFGSSKSQRDYEITASVDETVAVSWVIGAALAVPSRVFQAIGGWDSSFFIYYEDSDICLRARKHGYPTVLLGGVRWTHGWARATRRKFRLQAWIFEVRSASRFYGRYPKFLLPPVLAKLLSRPRN